MNFTLAQMIKQQYKQDCQTPFPLEDVRKLRSRDSENYVLLHGQLELYFSYIAGYASSADRLDRRSKAELIEAKNYLSQSFFERYPVLAGYREAITPEFTPNLFRDLARADKLRNEILVIIDSILA